MNEWLWTVLVEEVWLELRIELAWRLSVDMSDSLGQAA